MDVPALTPANFNEAVSPDDLVRGDEQTIDVHEAYATRPAADDSTRWLRPYFASTASKDATSGNLADAYSPFDQGELPVRTGRSPLA
jgi:hypothetical protein